MGDVALIIKVMPESPEVDREEIKKQIRATLPRVQDIQEEPIGFGLVALKVVAVVPDAEGQTDAAEAAINAIAGVERAEIIGSTLV
ncbi:MAG TPA: elongation factor 1-beta [Methanospirillum sp.]|nr:elongation factor 1-beta [Methanospirillum sp.]